MNSRAWRAWGVPAPSSAVAITTARRARKDPPGFHSALTMGMARSSAVAPSPSMARVRVLVLDVGQQLLERVVAPGLPQRAGRRGAHRPEGILLQRLAQRAHRI